SLAAGAPVAWITSWPSAIRPFIALHVSPGGVRPIWPKISSSRETWSRVSPRCSSNALRSLSSDALCAIFGSASTSCCSALSRSSICSMKTSSIELSCIGGPLLRRLSIQWGLSDRAVRKRSFALRLDRVLRVARGLEAGLEHRPAETQLACTDERGAEHRRAPAATATARQQERARARQPLRRRRQLPGRAPVVDLAGLPEAELHRVHRDRLRRDAGHRQPSRRPRLARVEECTGRRPGARAGARPEEPGKLV